MYIINQDSIGLPNLPISLNVNAQIEDCQTAAWITCIPLKHYMYFFNLSQSLNKINNFYVIP